jgi:NAD(P)-dependent dehydrogenase (short-subunit alcohol dehydrogenase family)
MKKVIVVTGASSGFGALASRALARAGHTVYAGIRDTEGGTAYPVVLTQEYAAKQGVDLRVGRARLLPSRERIFSKRFAARRPVLEMRLPESLLESGFCRRT